MRASILASLALLGACTGEFAIADADRFEGEYVKPDLSPPEKTDIITQVTKPEVDILWVVDNSGSMGDEQNKLAENFPKFMEFFLSSGLDYHIGITSTDTSQAGLNGRLKAVSTFRYITPDVQDPVNVFATMARLGTNGSADETGSLAAYRALEMPTQVQQNANQGFYRENASLHVIVVSDEPDSSYGFGSGWNFSVAEFINWLNNKKGDPDIPVSFSAIAGPVPNGCTGDGGLYSGADPGTEYKTIQENVGRRDGGPAPGQFFSICEDDWGPVLENLGLLASALRKEYFLSEVPVEGTIAVVVETPDGAVVEGIDAMTLPPDYTREDLESECEALGAASCFDFEYVAPRNSILLPNYVPPPQSKIKITYELLSGRENSEDFEFGGDTD